jgi:hypothetical protein
MIAKMPHLQQDQLQQMQSLIIAIKHQSTCNEAGLFATAVATNALVKNLYVVISGNNANKVAPCGIQC